MAKCKICGTKWCKHKGLKWIVETEPTCNKPGKEIEICDNPLCHEHFTDASGKVHYHETGNTRKIPATGKHVDKDHNNRCDDCEQQIAPED